MAGELRSFLMWNQKVAKTSHTIFQYWRPVLYMSKCFLHLKIQVRNVLNHQEEIYYTNFTSLLLRSRTRILWLTKSLQARTNPRSLSKRVIASLLGYMMRFFRAIGIEAWDEIREVVYDGWLEKARDFFSSSSLLAPTILWTSFLFLMKMKVGMAWTSQRPATSWKKKTIVITCMSIKGNASSRVLYMSLYCTPL